MQSWGGKQRLLVQGEAFLLGNSCEGSMPLVLKRARRFWLADVHSRQRANHDFLGKFFWFLFHDACPFLQFKGEDKSFLGLQIADLVKLANGPGAE